MFSKKHKRKLRVVTYFGLYMLQTYVHTYIHTYIHTHTHSLTHTHMHTHTHAHTRIYIKIETICGWVFLNYEKFYL
jgi:hypothetical protein